MFLHKSIAIQSNSLYLLYTRYLAGFPTISRPGPTRACTLPSAAKKSQLHDSIMNQTRKQMNYSSYNASISVCIQHIVNLSINTLQTIEYLQNLLEYDGS